MPRKSKDGITWLSHSAIGGMYACPRCFWLFIKKGIKHPEGIQSRLAGRFDRLTKAYFHLFREAGKMPPLIEGKVLGTLENPLQASYSYRYNDAYGLKGQLDECLVLKNRQRIPVDHKTSSGDPRKKDSIDAYGHQLNAYALLLEENGKPTAGFGYLIYYYPDDTTEMHKGVPLVIHIEKLKTDPEAARKELKAAIAILEKPMPEASPTCVFCNWHETLKGLNI